LFDLKSIGSVLGRLFLAGALIVGSVQLFRLVLLPEIQGTFALDEAATSAVRRIGILLVLVLAYWTFVRLIEGRAATELRFAPVDTGLGLLSGAALISIATVSLFAFGIYEVVAVRGLESALWGVAGMIFVAATLEEIAYRCVLFGVLESAWGTIPALCLQSLVFAVMHIANIDDTGSLREVITTVVAVTLIGALWTMVYVVSRNLWVVAAHHAAWNFAIILTGLPLSGIESWRAVAPFESRYNGPGWLTGGVFGPEDSVVTIAIVIMAVAALLYVARKSGRLIRV
jgi:hypothetical protein